MTREDPKRRARKVTIEIQADGEMALRMEIDRHVFQKILTGDVPGAALRAVVPMTPDLLQILTSLSRSATAAEGSDMDVMHAVNEATAHEEWRKRGHAVCPGCGKDLGTS